MIGRSVELDEPLGLHRARPDELVELDRFPCLAFPPPPRPPELDPDSPLFGRSANEVRCLKHWVLSNYIAFCRVFFRSRDGARFIVNRHHDLIAAALDRVFRGESSRLIINIPPGYTKTEMVVILAIARGLAQNPRSKFLLLSNSEDLALENSLKARDTIQGELYQALFPMTLRADSKAKGRWYNEHGGGVQAAPAGGQVIGFRAGRMEPGFSGAILIDDPLKPDDARSDAKRNRINVRYNTTIASRLAHEKVPIILVMQRIDDDDLSAYLLGGGSGEHWDHLEIPAEVPVERGPYPEEFSHGKQIAYALASGPLWPYKHDQPTIDELKTNPRTAGTFSAQYQQRPAPPGGSIFRDPWWRYFDRVDLVRSIIYFEGGETRIQYKAIFADTAQKLKESNDWSVFELWAKGEDGRIYLLDLVRGRFEAPDLRREFLVFCEKHDYKQGVIATGVRERLVEDKSSGTGLIQDINREKGRDYITGIPRDTDKVSRARSGAPSIAAGLVVLPRIAPWLADYRVEFAKFSATMSHKFDDQVDPTLDAIHKMIIGDEFLGYASMV